MSISGFIPLLLILFTPCGSDTFQSQVAQIADFESGSKNSYAESPQTGALTDLPIRVLETTVESDLPLLVYLSGDGGWNTFNESLCWYLNQHGIPVVALDSKKYFWKSKTPEQTASDLSAVVETYRKKMNRERFVMAGYSFGAAIVPFLLKYFREDTKSGLSSIIMIAPDKTSDFEIHLSDMMNLGLSKGKYDLLEELHKSEYKKFTAIFASDENIGTRQAFQQAGVTIKVLPGNHHFDKDYAYLGEEIFAEMKQK